MQKAEYLLQGSDDSDLNSCIGFRHTDKYCEGLIPMRFSNCLVVVRDFFAPKLPAQELPDKIKALKKKGFIPLLCLGESPKEKSVQEKKAKPTNTPYLI